MAELIVKVDMEPLCELLTEIRDRLPGAASEPVRPPKGSELAAAKRAALQAVLDTLDGWIAGARSNHDALGHRGENTGDECWREFAPGDFRRMVNDAACEVGVREFPYPKKPIEDRI